MQTQHCTHTITAVKPPSVFFPSWAKRMMALLLAWSARSRQRRALEALNDAALRDIGLIRSDVHREISKTFWQP